MNGSTILLDLCKDHSLREFVKADKLKRIKIFTELIQNPADLHSEAVVSQLESLIYTFDAEKITEINEFRSIQRNLSFCGFFGKNDLSLSLVLESGWFMKYHISIESLFKQQFLEFLKDKNQKVDNLR